MLRLFYSEAKPTPRFTQKIESDKILELLAKLKSKENELKKSSKKQGSSSPDYAKYLVISHLLINLNKAINSFNDKPIVESEIQESHELLNLLRELAEYIKIVKDHHQDIINAYRNNHNQTVKSVLGIATVGAVAASAVYLPFMMAAGSSFLAGFVNSVAQDNFIDDEDTATSKIIKEFSTTLKQSIKNLVLAINLKQLAGDPIRISSEDNMLCPILNQLMEEPVTCLLDGYSYEKAAIVRWLTEHRTSPMTRKEMPENARVEDMIIENRTLKSIIEDYKYHINAFGNQPEEAKVAEMRH